MLIVSCALSIWAIGAPVQAEPIDVTITITSGSVTYSPDSGTVVGLLQLYGTDGFSLISGPGGGVTLPTCCLAPGATTTMRAFWSSSDLLSVVTYNGYTINTVGSPNSVNNASVNFLSTPFTLPEPDGATAITITAPFSLTGNFSGVPGSGQPPATPTVTATLVGSGIGTISFTWLGAFGLNVWDPGLATFHISSAEDVVPEPSSIILACLSLAGVYGVRRHHRRRSL
jgi:hypothetical protein